LAEKISRLIVTCCLGKILTEPTYFEPDLYDLPLLIRVNPNLVANETTVVDRSIDSLSEQHRPIFQALTQVLSPLGVRFEFSLQHHPQQQFTNDGEQTIFQSADACWQTLEYRLCVRCYSQKTLDCQLLAEPLAKKLRSLNLQHFQDAIVQFSRFSVREQTPASSQIADWLLRIDLTPPAVRLRSWARWGDVQAIAKLLNLSLETEGIQISAVLKNLTLQIFCTLKQSQSAKFPPKKIVLDTIAPLLISLTPQGIQGATIHGLQSQPDFTMQMEEPPIWIHWLDLPALGDPKFSPTPILLAARGDEGALNFILERLLNPDLEQCFEVGGIGLSLLYRHHLLHVMSEAPICPIQSQVATIVVKVIGQLKLPGIRGVRVHGRISGQSISIWTYGVDFDAPQQLLPPRGHSESPKMAAEPQFASLSVNKIGLGVKIAAYLTTTGIWKPQLAMDKPDRLVYSPRFEWQPSLLLLLVGLGLAITSDLAMKFALEARNLTASPTTTLQLSFNNPLLEQKLAQYQLRCLQHGVPDVLIVGSSRALRGINPEVLRRSSIDRGNPNLKIYNFGINGATAQVVDLILRQLLTPQQLPKLVIWADGARAFNSGRIDRTYESITQSDRYRQLALMSGIQHHNLSLFQAQSSLQNTYQAIDTAVDLQLAKVSPAYHHRDRIKNWLQARVPTIGSLSDRHNSAMSVDPIVSHESTSQEIDFDGFLALELQFDPATYYQKYPKVTGDSDGDYQNFQLLGSQDRALHQTIDLLTSHKIPLVFVNMPLSDIYLDNFRRQHESSFKQYMQKLMDSRQLTFIDMDGMLNTQYDRFSDPSHLNQVGAIDTSKYLARILTQRQGKKFIVDMSK
jgi:Protein of unknown function (DUF1574)